MLAVGVGLAAAGVLAAGPTGPAAAGIQHRAAQIQHRAVQLTSGQWDQVLATAGENLQSLQGPADTASAQLSQAVESYWSVLDGQLGGAFTGAATGLQNAFYGGWYGSDDGYVFGLFGGSVTDPSTGVTETGSTLEQVQTALQQGNPFNAFAYLDTWALETLDHTMKSLLNPLLSVTSQGVTTPSILFELSETQSNLLEQLGTYANLKDLSNALLSPVLSVGFAFTSGLNEVVTDLSSGNVTQALTDLSDMPAELTGALLNGYQQVNSVNGSEEPFVGLLNSGSLLEELLVTWPTQLATALNETVAQETAALSPADLFSSF